MDAIVLVGVTSSRLSSFYIIDGGEPVNGSNNLQSNLNLRWIKAPANSELTCPLKGRCCRSPNRRGSARILLLRVEPGSVRLSVPQRSGLLPGGSPVCRAGLSERVWVCVRARAYITVNGTIKSS